MKITAYAEELLADLDQLEGWPEQVKLMQKNWIGKSTGVRFAFPYELTASPGSCGCSPPAPTRSWASPFCAVAAEHPLATYAAARNPQIAEFVEECKRGGVAEADYGDDGKEGHADRHLRHPSAEWRAGGCGSATTC
jgi:leucyl-tRNA synthetase